MDENEDLSDDILPDKEDDKKEVDENLPLRQKNKKIENDNAEQQEKLKVILNGLLTDLKKSENEKDDADENDDNNSTDMNLLLAFTENWNSTNKLKRYEYRTYLCLMFRVLLPIFTIIHLISIFQIMSIMNVLYDAIKNSIKCYLDFEDKEDKSSYEFYNFYGYYLKSLLDGGIEFDLMETMGFLGTLFFKYLGFGISSFIFLIVNSISLFLLINFFNRYNSSNDKYTMLQIIYLCFSYFLLFIGVGSSALLSQQILVDNWANYNTFIKENEQEKNKEKEENDRKDEQEREIEENDRKDEQKKEDKNKGDQENDKEEDKQNIYSFFCICITTVIGFAGKYTIDIIFSYSKTNFDQQYEDIDQFNNTSFNENITNIDNIIFSHDQKLFYIIFIIYVIFSISSILLHFLFGLIFDEKEEDKKNYYICSGVNNCKLFGYNIYVKYIPDLKSKKEENNNNNSVNENNEINYDLINEENNELNNNLINEENNENNPNEDNEKGPMVTKIVSRGMSKTSHIRTQQESEFIGMRCYKCCNCLKCICFFFKQLCFSLKLLSNSIKTCVSEIICRFCCCRQCCCCFCCECVGNCGTIEKKDYNLNEEFFCYCYKGERNLKWFDKFIKDETQIKIIPLLLNFFILQLITVAFQKLYNDNNEDQNYDFILKNKRIFSFTFVGSFALYLYLSYSFGEIMNRFDFLNKKTEGTLYNEMSSNILKGTFGIIIFCGIYSFFVSIACLSKDIQNNNKYFIVPILMNKFYSFTFAYHCTVFTDVDDNIELISSSTLIAIYLSIWDFFFGLISDYLPINLLLIIQIIFSLVIVLISFSLISVFLCCIGYFWLTLSYLLSFFALGGCWFFCDPCNCPKRISGMYKYEICKNHEKTCVNYLWFYNCFGKKRCLKLEKVVKFFELEK